MNLPPLASGNLLQSTGLGWAKKKCCHCNCYSHTVAYITAHMSDAGEVNVPSPDCADSLQCVGWLVIDYHQIVLAQ